MLQLLTAAQAQQYTLDDPVRAHLTAEFRTTQGREMWGLFEDSSSDPLAVICVAYTDNIPTSELELDWFSGAGVNAVNTTAVFYTVWSYNRGAGRTIVNTLAQHIKQTRNEIDQWVTLSPLTDMAEKFHTKNGAQLRSVHDTCQVFDYTHVMRDSKQARSA